ncbi:MAG: hypothetical protein Q9163_000458 [Psora crenata]
MIIPPMLYGLHALDRILTKAETHAKETNVPETTLLEARLHPDMKALPFQIQVVSDIAKSACVRVANAAKCPMEDTEKTFEELHTRIRKTVAVLEAVSEEDFAGREGVEVVLTRAKGEWRTTAKEYLLHYALPNFYFHFVTAYDILRHRGVPIGKLDYLGV